MPLDISLLNGASFNELQASEFVSVGNGLTINGNGTYTVTPDNSGNLAIYDNWSGFLATPGATDITSFNTSTGFTTPAGSLGVVGYKFTQGDGTVSPPSGIIGAEVVGWNANGVLLEQLSGYVPNAATVTPDGNFIVLGSIDLSTFDGSVVPGDSFTFGTTGAIPASAIPTIPEPSTAMIMPVLIVALMVSRLPGVRSFLGAR
jgi:hypothetical protein